VSAEAVRLIRIGKQYRRGTRAQSYSTLRDLISERAKGMLGRRRADVSGDGDARTFWAVRDVSFDVPCGSALGLIGPNGAGKSTLLKILSRVTSPTSGQVQLYGRVGSLLEVGTGFHPELTGRENVLLNGAILGMKRSEILAKFDEIVAFAEVDAFIDTPVKHYSSGMYLRLAFSVAAHLEPEILLVDEVLAVGDAAFQKRCLGKMDDVARNGRTVICVSHNLESIRRLCSHSVLLESGRVAAFGPTPAVVQQYLSRDYQRPSPGVRIDVSGVRRTGTGAARFMSVQYGADVDGVRGKTASNGQLTFILEIHSDQPRQVRSLAVFLCDQFGTKVLNADTLHIQRTVTLRQGCNVVKLGIAAVHLTPGFYRVGLWMADPVQARATTDAACDFVESAFEIEVVQPESAPLSGAGALVACDFDVEEVV
jgi:ABC-type polysaccharide/polyol phosphate transport system ATPase subunit